MSLRPPMGFGVNLTSSGIGCRESPHCGRCLAGDHLIKNVLEDFPWCFNEIQSIMLVITVPVRIPAGNWEHGWTAPPWYGLVGGASSNEAQRHSRSLWAWMAFQL